MYTHVLIDADDTIFDFEKAEKVAIERSFFKLQYHVNVDEVIKTYQSINKILWSDVEKGLINTQHLRVERFKRLFQELDMPLPTEEFSTLFIKHLGDGTYLLDGAEQMCRYLSEHYTVAIITNGIKEVQLSRLKQSAIKEYIKEIIISEDVGCSKPDPGIFEFAMQKLGHTDKQTMIMIGDSLSSDIQGGINFGIDTCWLNRNNIQNNTSVKPTYQIQTIDDIYDIL